MIERYKDYNEYLKDQLTTFESFEHELYFKEILQTVKYVFKDTNKDDRVLDLCCGDGSTTLALRLVGFRYIEGLDANPKKLDIASIINPNIDFICSDISRLRILSGFNIIYASHCFEHFLDPFKVLEDCKGLLEPNGTIIIIVPYPNSECEGHPGSSLLKLDGSIEDIKQEFVSREFKTTIEQVNIREPELIIKLTL